MGAASASDASVVSVASPINNGQVIHRITMAYYLWHQSLFVAVYICKGNTFFLFFFSFLLCRSVFHLLCYLPAESVLTLCSDAG